MNAYLINATLAQKIVQRTMGIIGCNINIMDADGIIIASGDETRIGARHAGAQQAIDRGGIVRIDDNIPLPQGTRPGINLPLTLDGQTVGVIGLTGSPDHLQEYAQLVRMSAEIMIEQAQLSDLLAQDDRLREELIRRLIDSDTLTPALREWGKRLNLDLTLPRVACIIEVDSRRLDIEAVRNELQHLQHLLKNPERDNLVAILSLSELVILKPALDAYSRWDNAHHLDRIHQLLDRMTDRARRHVRIALGHYFPASGEANGAALSYRTARHTLAAGKARHPDEQVYHYEALKLPVLLHSMKDGWQEKELMRTLALLNQADPHGLLRKTLNAWFANDMQSAATARALHIHRNTLDYRLNKIADLTALDLTRTDSRFLLYLALHLAA